MLAGCVARVRLMPEFYQRLLYDDTTQQSKHGERLRQCPDVSADGVKGRVRGCGHDCLLRPRQLLELRQQVAVQHCRGAEGGTPLAAAAQRCWDLVEPPPAHTQI